MEIHFKCDTCGQHITAPEEMAGQDFVCPNAACGRPLAVPSAPAPSEQAIDAAVDITFNCPWCNHELVVNKKGVGLKVSCPECGKPVIVPAQTESEKSAKTTSAWTPPPPPASRAAKPVVTQAAPVPVAVASGGAASVPRAVSRANAQAPSVSAPRPNFTPKSNTNPVAQAAQNPRSNNMMVEEMDFRGAIKHVVQAVIGIVALSILKAVVCSFLPEDVAFRGLSVDAWGDAAITFVIVGLIIKIYRPVETIITFYLSAFVKVGKLPGREKYLGNLIVVAEKLTLLAFVTSIYSYLRPVIVMCNHAFIRFSALTTILDVVVLIAAVGILLLVWKNARPLIELLTGRITETVSNLSNSIVYVACPVCNANNDRDAAFCATCGAKMEQLAAASQANANSFCPQCGAENLPSAKFCCKCGTSLGK